MKNMLHNLIRVSFI